MFNKKVKDSIENHYFHIKQKDNSLVFELKNVNLPFSKKYLIIKHRKTGKKISKQLSGSKVTLTLDDINEITHEGIFDISLNVKVFGRFFTKRTRFNSENEDMYLFDEDNKSLFMSYVTKGSNLSFEYSQTFFKADIDSITCNDNNVSINGKIRLYDDITFDTVELLSKSNKTGRKNAICSYNSDNGNFSCTFENDVSDMDISSKWNVTLRLINDAFILGSEQLSCDGFISKKGDEVIIDEMESELDNQKICTVFYANKNLKLQFRIVTLESHLKSLKKKDNKKLYDKFKKDGLKDNYVFFESFHGKYNNNPKYLYEKMLDLGFGENYQFIWAYDGDENLPGNPIVVKSNSEEYFKYLSQSKYRVNNTTFPIIDNRRDVIYIQTWHGTPLKRLAGDIRIKWGVSWNHFNNEVSTWNYLISANEYSTNTFKRAFNYNNEILQFGYPANDIFYKGDDFKSKFDIPDGKKVILYAPTFRDDKKDEDGNRLFDLELNLDDLYEKLGNEYFLIIKTHYVISQKLDISEKLKDFVVDLSSHDDIHELFAVSDILITDYSSSFFDFAHSKKPILFFMPDLKTYADTRGLYSEIIPQLPGPILKNNDEIIEALLGLDAIVDDYKIRYDKFYNNYCNEGKGDSSLRIIKHVWGDEFD